MPSLISHFYRNAMRRINIFRKPGISLADLRPRIDRATRFSKVASGVKILEQDADGVPAEWVIPSGAPEDRVILYIHGGAWIICSPRTHRGMVSQLAGEARTKALVIDYRLAPEHPFPAGLEDCLTAYRWLLKQGIQPNRIVFAGDSAGGNLTLATLLALKDSVEPLPAAAVCLSPATDLASTGDSFRTRAKVDPLFGNAKATRSIIPQYIGSHDVYDPLVSPLYGDLHGLPPILIHVGDDEILLDDSTRFIDKARAAGVDAQVVVWPNMWHVFQMHAPTMPEAKESIRQLGEFIRRNID